MPAKPTETKTLTLERWRGHLATSSFDGRETMTLDADKKVCVEVDGVAVPTTVGHLEQDDLVCLPALYRVVRVEK